MDGTDAALVAATALHAGFQLTVTLLVYPGFADAPPQRWAAHHAAHGRRITPLVGVVYAALIVACGAALVGSPTPAQLVSVASVGAVLLVTATVAVPAHRRLSVMRDPQVLRRLVVADRARCVAAVLAAVAAASAGLLD